MNPTIIIPSMNHTLANLARMFIPGDWPVIVKDGNPYTHFDEIRKIDIGTKWAINVDEDCFLINPNGVIKLIRFMENNGYDTAGIQDGSSYIRHHNPVLFNPFFFVFNVEKLQSAPKITADIPTESEKYAHLIKFKHLPHKFDGFEPYYPFFFDLLKAGLNPLFLANHALDSFSTEGHGYGKPSILLDEEGGELAIHAWYSRFFNDNPIIQKRIQSCIDYAVAERIKIS